MLFRETGWWGLRGSSLFCMSLLIWLLHTAPEAVPLDKLSNHASRVATPIYLKDCKTSRNRFWIRLWHHLPGIPLQCMWEHTCSKLRSCAKGSLFCYQGHCTWLIQSADCQRVSWNCRVNWLTRHLSFSSSQASLQSLGLSLHSQPDSPSSAKLTNSSVQYFFLVGGS